MTLQSDHEQLRDFYNESYYSRDFALKNSSWHDRFMATKLGDLHGKQVLDIACGGGMWLNLLRQKGATIAGVDISDRAIEFCNLHYPDGNFHVGVAEDLPFDEGLFDVVTCLGSLEHFGDKPGALREMQRVAKPGAMFLILVPNSGFLTRRLGWYRGTLQTAIREDVYSLDEWKLLFEDAGFSVVEKCRDLHVLSLNWMLQKGWLYFPVRALQACALALWPLNWQYQVHHVLIRKSAA